MFTYGEPSLWTMKKHPKHQSHDFTMSTPTWTMLPTWTSHDIIVFKYLLLFCILSQFLLIPWLFLPLRISNITKTFSCVCLSNFSSLTFEAYFESSKRTFPHEERKNPHGIDWRKACTIKFWHSTATESRLYQYNQKRITLMKKNLQIKLCYRAYILAVVQYSQFKSVINFFKLFLFCGQIVALLPISGNNIFYYSLSWNNSKVSPNCHIACSKRLAQVKSLALTQVNPTTNSCVLVRILERSQ